MLYTSGPVSLKEGLMLVLINCLQNKSRVSIFCSNKILLFPVFTSQQIIQQVHPIFILCLVYHTALPQFVSFPNNFVLSRIYVSFLNKSTDLKFLQRRSKSNLNFFLIWEPKLLKVAVIVYLPSNRKAGTWEIHLIDSVQLVNLSSPYMSLIKVKLW